MRKPATERPPYEHKKQHYHVASIPDSSVAVLGSGQQLLGIENTIESLSPLQRNGMSLEITSGSGQRQGSIRLYPPDPDPEYDPSIANAFLLHAAVIDEILFLPVPLVYDQSLFFRVVIVPTAAVGAGSFMGSSPRIVIFDLPKLSELSGIMGGENAQTTYVEPVVEKMFNGEEFLGTLGKHVVKLDAAEFASNVKARNEVEPLYTKYGRGILYFLPTGIFRGWDNLPLYLSHESIKRVSIHVGEKHWETFSLTIEVYAPHHPSTSTTKPVFMGLTKQDLEPVKRYFYKHCADYVEVIW